MARGSTAAAAAEVMERACASAARAGTNCGCICGTGANCGCICGTGANCGCGIGAADGRTGGGTAGADVRTGGGTAGADVRLGIGGGAAMVAGLVPIAMFSGGIDPPRIGGAVIDRTFGCGKCCCVPPADRVRGNGATSPAPRIGGTVADIRGGFTVVLRGFAKRSSDGSESGLSLLLLCTNPINSFTAVDSLAMDAPERTSGRRIANGPRAVKRNPDRGEFCRRRSGATYETNTRCADLGAIDTCDVQIASVSGEHL